VSPPGQTPVLDTSELGNGIVLGVAPASARVLPKSAELQYAAQ
jgi:hypothetical protein